MRGKIGLSLLLLGMIVFGGDFVPVARAEKTIRTDSIEFKYQWTRTVPLTLFAVSTPSLDQSVYKWRNSNFSSFRTRIDDYSSLIPVATSWGLYFGGVKPSYSRNAGEMFLLQGGAILLSTAVTHIGKRGFGRERPDGRNYKSFPSGHTSFAFVCATLLVEEYGERYPWLAALSYTSASLTATARILNNRHWVSDLAGGAVVGILSAKLTYMLGALATGRSYRPYTFRDEPLKGYAFSFQRGWNTSSKSISNCFGVGVRIPLYEKWGIAVQTEWSSEILEEDLVFGRSIGGGVSYRREFLWDDNFLLDGRLFLEHTSHFNDQSRNGWGIRPELGLLFRTGNVSLLRGYAAVSSAPWRERRPAAWEFGLGVEWGW
ncbi:MAG: phosphatase PAP2 family protein [Porphyromonas sp.]|nr:phosphatase PAP2 family protein [Porphyromonas sp.]